MPACQRQLYHRVFLHRVWTNKPRNYNCLPAASLIGGNNDISALLIFLARRLASAYWGTCHTHVWWGEFNLSVRNDNGVHFNVRNDICQGSTLCLSPPSAFLSTYPSWNIPVRRSGFLHAGWIRPWYSNVSLLTFLILKKKAQQDMNRTFDNYLNLNSDIACFTAKYVYNVLKQYLFHY